MKHILPIGRCAADGPAMAWHRGSLRATLLLAGCCIPVVPVVAQVAPCAPAPAHDLSAKLAVLKVGDYWIYEQSGTMTVPASASTAAATLPLSGTFVEDVETRMFQGRPTLALVVVQNLTIGGVSIYGNSPAPQEIFYVKQDPTTNDVLVLGDNATPTGAAEVAAKPAEFYLGTWSMGASYNDTLDFPSAKTGLYLNVTGTTTIKTRIGNFQAWVAPNGATTATGGVLDSGIDYWSPQLGAPVAFSTTTNLPTGGVRTLTATLIKSSRVASLYPVLADSLDHPRGLAFDPLGDLWFTEAGTGGAGPCIAFMGNSNCFGNTGKVSVLAFGQRFVVDGTLASLATPLVDQASGPNGITFSNGRPYVIIGDGGPQSAVNSLGSLQNQTGVLGTVGLSGSTLVAQAVASVADYEYANDPDHRPNPDGTLTPESNPFGVTSTGGNVFVADGGAHTVLQVTPGGAISVVGVIPAQQVSLPSPSGAPTAGVEDSVPTGIMPAPDGHGLLVADYTGYPYLPGTSRIWRVQQGQSPVVYASGFTNLIGLSPAGDGGVYALEMVSSGATSSDLGGSVVHVSPSGQQTVLACQGLIQPTGITTGQDGSIYVSNYGVTPGYGQIVKISPQ